ncbi:LPS translocon maturation chaperone LptM [Martelella endophytica]|uniref:Lipoprotein n=1 Tax=Martelella endophytica TaxID=1486262 RepID=A0A0D5LTW6_MAREN|nr:lipoprotein [Martelella endophytica]AJY47501.1 hypothetical protein TM49_20430 [Martelella endophytica]
MRKFTIAVIALMLGALALSGCGRKGPLELPPETAKQQAANAQQQDIEVAPNDKPVVLDGTGRSIELGPAAQGQDEGDSFFLDALIQ